MGVRYCEAWQLRSGDVIVHAATGERLTVVQKAFFANRIILEDESGARSTVACDPLQEVMIPDEASRDRVA